MINIVLHMMKLSTNRLGWALTVSLLLHAALLLVQSVESGLSLDAFDAGPPGLNAVLLPPAAEPAPAAAADQELAEAERLIEQKTAELASMKQELAALTQAEDALRQQLAVQHQAEEQPRSEKQGRMAKLQMEARAREEARAAAAATAAEAAALAEQRAAEQRAAEFARLERERTAQTAREENAMRQRLETQRLAEEQTRKAQAQARAEEEAKAQAEAWARAEEAKLQAEAWARDEAETGRRAAAESAAALAKKGLEEARDGLLSLPPRNAAEKDPGGRGSVGTAYPRDIALANYSDGWRQKVERIGAISFPRLSKNRADDTLVATVKVNSDGSLAEVRIERSSGHQDLDDAVRRIIELSAPFPAFPAALKRRLAVAAITREWSFREERPKLDARRSD